MVRRGCKRSFGPREQEASCTGAKWGCIGAKEGLGGAKDSWETFAPWAQKSQKDLLHPPLATFGDFPFLGNFPGPQHPNIGVVPRCLIHLATKGVRQKEFDKKVTTKGASLQKMHLKNFKHITLKRKSPKVWPNKPKTSDRTPLADLLQFRRPDTSKRHSCQTKNRETPQAKKRSITKFWSFQTEGVFTCRIHRKS